MPGMAGKGNWQIRENVLGYSLIESVKSGVSGVEKPEQVKCLVQKKSGWQD
jgi:hypothetical protein